GIAVAVESVILFNYFQARVSKEAFDLTLKADELVETVHDRAEALHASLSASRPAPADAPAAAPERVRA
ncbi:MAG: hypothetical protein ACJ79D_00570, partial [Myxococcales bacterium]